MDTWTVINLAILVAGTAMFMRGYNRLGSAAGGWMLLGLTHISIGFVSQSIKWFIS